MSHTGGPGATTGVGTPTVRGSLLRMVVLTLPGQLLGVVLTTVVLTVLTAPPTSGAPYLLIPVLSGAIGGAAVGLLVSPSAVVAPFLRAAGLVATASWLVLLALAQLNLPAGSPRPAAGGVLLGLLLVVAAQLAVCWAFWRRPAR